MTTPTTSSASAVEKILHKKNLGEWVAQLGAYDVQTPVFGDDAWSYQALGDGQTPRLDHPNTVEPPKGFHFPQREVFYTYRQVSGEAPVLDSTVPDPATTVVFGVRPCDGRGAPCNDRVFSGEMEDPYYRARRSGTILIGLACNKPPSANCFCLAVGGSPHSDDGLDILMTDLENRYAVKALTDQGAALVTLAEPLFGEPGDRDRKDLEETHALSRQHPQRTLPDMEAVPGRLEAEFDSPLWSEMARACIGCGICTFLCPTCHCFDITDEVTGSTPLEGRRVRTWDTCQFPDFTMHSSGHNPRPDCGSRLRQRVCHKFLYFFENHGTHQCVGCGRCITECPVGIDIVAIVNRVAGHAK